MKKILPFILTGTVIASSVYCGVSVPPKNFMAAYATVNDSSGEVIDNIRYRRAGTYSLLGVLPEDYDKECMVVDECTDKYVKEVTLLSELEGTNGGGTRMMPVGRINEAAFNECEYLEKIVIPDSVTQIDRLAFRNCSSLSEVNLPDGIETIGEYAFARCNLSGTITLPKNLQTLGDYVFGQNVDIDSYTISEDNEYFTTENGILYDKDKKEILIYPANAPEKEYIAPDTLNKVHNGAFLFNQHLEKVTLGKNVEQILNSAFTESSIEDIYILNDYCDIHDNEDVIPYYITIHGHEGSTAQEYAEKYGNEFIVIESEDVTTTAPITTTTTTTTVTTTSTTESTTTTTTIESSTATTSTTEMNTTTSTTTTEETTTTSTTTTTKATTTTTKPTTTTEVTTTEATTTTKWYASEEDYKTWAIKDYADKHGVTPSNAEITENEDSTLSITLTDENGEVLDTYTINPETGKGESSNGAEVNLPQTGITSPKSAVAAVGSVLTILLGSALVCKSRKRRDE